MLNHGADKAITAKHTTRLPMMYSVTQYTDYIKAFFTFLRKRNFILRPQEQHGFPCADFGGILDLSIYFVDIFHT